MNKSTALILLGGSVREAAEQLNLSTQAVHKWAEKGSMPRPICDRVLAHLVRRALRRDAKLRRSLEAHLPVDALADVMALPTPKPHKPKPKPKRKTKALPRPKAKARASTRQPPLHLAVNA